MEEKEVKLSVNALKISFRTDGGKVQAVRNVSFDLHKGETLAIVGESGSGKSVTNRAIMGILAGNAIKEGGEIIYDGQDLMKISEEDFQQDPRRQNRHDIPGSHVQPQSYHARGKTTHRSHAHQRQDKSKRVAQGVQQDARGSQQMHGRGARREGR